MQRKWAWYIQIYRWDIFIGDMLNGERHGYGKQIYENGVIFVGEWKMGKRNGRGTFTDSDGKVYEYDFKDGEPIDP